jgi:hypothetical protein
MSLLRSGASKKYSENWASVFGGSGNQKKKATAAKATAKKSKAKPRKKGSKK